MAELKIPYIKEMIPENPKIIADRLMASGTIFIIDRINWRDFSHLPDVEVYSGYCDKYLWLHYKVSNDFVRAICRQDQEPVWQDSCVEFFVKQGDNYRNFEFNSLGICLSACGPDRKARESLEMETMAQILRFPSLTSDSLPHENTPADWSLTVAIPLNLIGLKAGSQFLANFYKCGDSTLVPHYVSWSAIGTPSPDFHQPGYFGLAELVN